MSYPEQVKPEEFFFDICPHCYSDISEPFFCQDAELECGHYQLICPVCGNSFDLIFTYTLMTYPTPGYATVLI